MYNSLFNSSMMIFDSHWKMTSSWKHNRLTLSHLWRLSIGLAWRLQTCWPLLVTAWRNSCWRTCATDHCRRLLSGGVRHVYRWMHSAQKKLLYSSRICELQEKHYLNEDRELQHRYDEGPEIQARNNIRIFAYDLMCFFLVCWCRQLFELAFGFLFLL